MPFQIIREDITNMDVDAIVNSANPKPMVGYGLDTMVYQKAGWKKIFEKRKAIGDIAPGQAAYTDGGDLKARYIIHAVGPAWQGGDHHERELLASSYRSSLELAEGLKCQSVAFPLISSGNYQFPKDEALTIALSEVNRFLLTSEMTVYLVVYDRKAVELSGRLFQHVDAYIDDHYVLASYEEIDEAYEDHIAHREDSLREDSLRPGAGGNRRKEAFYGSRPSFAPRPSAKESYSGFSMSDKLENIIKKPGKNFAETLFNYIDEKGLDDVSVYKKANVSRKVFSKIKSNSNYTPKKNTVLAFAVAMELSLPETQDLLSRAGYALSPSSISDLIVQYYIIHGVYNLLEINICLFDHNQPVLGTTTDGM